MMSRKKSLWSSKMNAQRVPLRQTLGFVGWRVRRLVYVYLQQNKKARAEGKKCHAKTMMSRKALGALMETHSIRGRFFFSKMVWSREERDCLLTLTILALDVLISHPPFPLLSGRDMLSRGIWEEMLLSQVHMRFTSVPHDFHQHTLGWYLKMLIHGRASPCE
jgi:hypothetical protein